jgi:molybdenum cofactor synthesis domain-containing protein
VIRVAILTISDSYYEEHGSDRSGDAIQGWCERRGDTIAARERVADETASIVPVMLSLADSGDVDLILTTGGTGLSPRDVTPEATRAVIEREANGLAEYLRATAFNRMPRAALSRGIAGTRGRTLIVNLPGSTSGVQDGLAALMPIIDHAIGILTGSITRHDTPPYGQAAI